MVSWGSERGVLEPDMRVKIFELFTRTIKNLPTEAIFKVVDLECKMLKDDYENHGIDLPEDAFSIFSFRQFLRLAKYGETMRCIKPLPPDHIEFYKMIIVRLIQANLLPTSAIELFDRTFHLLCD
jgi:hypothetical protein